MRTRYVSEYGLHDSKHSYSYLCFLSLSSRLDAKVPRPSHHRCQISVYSAGLHLPVFDNSVLPWSIWETVLGKLVNMIDTHTQRFVFTWIWRFSIRKEASGISYWCPGDRFGGSWSIWLYIVLCFVFPCFWRSSIATKHLGLIIWMIRINESRYWSPGEGFGGSW